MERNKLVKELASFFFVYGILGRELEESAIKEIIENSLDKIELVETLINKLTDKVKACNYVEIEQAKAFLLELERIRIELDFKDFKGNQR